MQNSKFITVKLEDLPENIRKELNEVNRPSFSMRALSAPTFSNNMKMDIPKLLTFDQVFYPEHINNNKNNK